MKDRYIKNVTTIKLDQSKCINCQMCIKVCPREVFILENDKLILKDRDLCIECGACSLNCPTDALSVRDGVGCASLMIKRFFLGPDAECGCGDGKSGCC